MSKQKKKAHAVKTTDAGFLEKINKKYVLVIALVAVLIPLVINFSPYLFEDLSPIGTDIVASKGQTSLYQQWETETGEKALWNPNIFVGMPTYHRITPQIIQFDSLIWLLNEIGYWAFFYFIAGVFGMFALLYYKKIPWYVAVIVAIAFALLPDWQALVGDGHFTKLRAIMVLPWVLLTFSYFFDKNNWFGAAAFSFIFAWMFRTQHFQIVFYTILLLFIMYIYPYIKLFIDKNYKRALSLLLKFAVAIVLTVITAAQPFLSMREYAPYSTRGGNPLQIGESHESARSTGGVDLDYATQWSLAPSEMLDFFVQRFHGGISAETYDGTKYAQLKGQQIPGYWGQKPFSGNYNYFGIVLFLFALLGLIKNYKDPFVMSLGAFVVVSLLLSFGRHFIEFYKIFYYLVPYFSKFRAPAMMANITFIAFLILSGYGIKTLFTMEHPKDTRLLVSVFGSGILFGVIILLFKDSFSYVSPVDARYQAEYANIFKEIRKEFLTADTTRMLIITVVTTLTVLGYYFHKIKKDVFVVVLLAVVLIELYPSYNKAFDKIDLGHKENVVTQTFKENELTKYLRGRSNTDRLLVLGKEFQSNHYAYFHPQVNGYSAIKTQLIQDINEHSLYKANTPEKINWNVINMLNGKYIITDGLIQKDFLEREAYSQTAKQVLYENKNALPKAWFVKGVKSFATPEEMIFYMNDTTFSPQSEALLSESDKLASDEYNGEGSVKVDEYNPNKLKLTVETDNPQLLVVSELYYPAAWHAYLDGEPVSIHQVNHLLRGIEIPAGKHDLEFVMHSSTFSTAMTLSWIGNLATLLLLAIFGYLTFYKPKETTQNQQPEN